MAAHKPGGGGSLPDTILFDDGYTIAITSIHPDGSGAYVLPITGSYAAPRLSPDKTQVVANDINDPSHPRIAVFDIDGQNVVALTPEGDINDNPNWSRDGTKIAYNAQTVGDTIHIMDADGSNDYEVTADYSATGHAMPWSLDDSELLISSSSSGPDVLRIAASDGTLIANLTADTADSCRAQDWSPDGERVLFARDAGGGIWEIWEMDADSGANKTQITTLGLSAFSAQYSPDGTRIAVQVYLLDFSASTIYVMERDGSNIVNLTEHLPMPPGHVSDLPQWESPCWR
jgi:Tol biopolymer transport system component